MTLFHYDLPEAIAKEGGQENHVIVDAFAEYARVCFITPGDRVKPQVTINEPKYYAYCSYMVGNHPPNHRHDLSHYFMMAYHEAVVSAKAVATYHSLKLNRLIGIVHDSSSVEVAPDTKEKERVHMITDLLYNRIILDATCRGESPGALTLLLWKYGTDTSYIKFRGMLVFLQGKVDSLGLNIYNRFYIMDYPAGETEVFHNSKGAGSSAKEGVRIRGWYETAIDPDTEQNLQGREIYLKRMYSTLMEIKKRYRDTPVYITESGHGCCEKPNDEGRVESDKRIEMMQGYTGYTLKVTEGGCNIGGYYVWSTTGLCSQVNGYEKCYGFVRADFGDHNR